MQKFFEQLASVVGAALQWLDEERGIEAHEVQEMAIDFTGKPLMERSPIIYMVEAAGWELFLWDYFQNGECEVYHSQTKEGYCYPDCHCSWCQLLREQNAVA